MNTILTVDDPLADQEVTIVMTLVASGQPRDERPILISLGTPGHLPILKSGLLPDAISLIQEAWAAFGLRSHFRETPSDQVMAAEAETVAEETVVAAAETTDDRPAPAAPPPTPAPRPQAKNLSLF